MQRVKVLVREGDSRLPEGFREQILWEHEGKFVITSRLVGGRFGYNETVAYPATSGGEFLERFYICSDEGILCVHEQVASDAFDSPYFR